MIELQSPPCLAGRRQARPSRRSQKPPQGGASRDFSATGTQAPKLSVGPCRRNANPSSEGAVNYA